MLVIFDIDDVLYDASLLKRVARERAILSMIDSGLPVDFETAMKVLRSIIKEKGEDYSEHFNELLRRLHVKESAKIVAAGVVAYHNAKFAFLEPLPRVVETLVKLRDEGIELGVASIGRAVKDWEKLIRLNLHHLFHRSWVGLRSWEEILIYVSKGVLVTADPSAVDILHGSGIKVIRVMRGNRSFIRTQQPPLKEVKHTCEVLKAIESLTEG